MRTPSAKENERTAENEVAAIVDMINKTPTKFVILLFFIFAHNARRHTYVRTIHLHIYVTFTYVYVLLYILYIILRRRHRSKRQALFCSPRGQHLIQSVLDGGKVCEIVPELGLKSTERKQIERFVSRIREDGWESVLMVKDVKLYIIHYYYHVSYLHYYVLATTNANDCSCLRHFNHNNTKRSSKSCFVSANMGT